MRKSESKMILKDIEKSAMIMKLKFMSSRGAHTNLIMQNSLDISKESRMSIDKLLN